MDTLVDTTPGLWFIRPLMGYGDFVDVGGQLFVTVAVGNPLVWLAVLPAAGYLLVKARGERGVLLIQAMFWASYVPLAMTSRPVWVLSSIAVTPFAFALVAMALSRLSAGKLNIEIGMYLTAVLLVTIFLYPMCIGTGWENPYLQPIMERLNPH